MFRGPGHFMGAELEGEIPSYAEHDDFLVNVPALKELLCRGGSVIACRYRQKASFSSSHQNRLTHGLKSGTAHNNWRGALYRLFQTPTCIYGH